ncbi:MAG: aminotransferase class IV [Bacteroidia bacterium]|nr:aminotransferase class IV [Bacteroidia bacterium]
MTRIFNINGQIVPEDAPAISASSRAYRYGDGFFESMKLSNGVILHADKHMARIHKSAMLLKMHLPDDFHENIIQQRVNQSVEGTGISNARVRCTVLREAQGLYTPIDSEILMVIEIVKTDSPFYDFNQTGLILGSYAEMTKNANFISTVKSTSALLYVMAGIHAKENGFDECVIFNENGRIAETISSNIFTVSGEFINTPALSEYCVDGVMRRVVIQLAQAYGYTVLEQPISEITLQTADEIFLTSATRGIRWVGDFKGKNYSNHVSRVLAEKLNPTPTLF